MIIETEVLCFSEKMESLTGKSDDIWLEIMIDLSEALAVKQDTHDMGEAHQDRSVVYFVNDYFIIKKPYNEMKTLFIHAKERKL